MIAATQAAVYPAPDARREPADAQTVDAILALVRTRTGVDFSLYRRATIERRIGNRMISFGAAALEDYLAHLRHDEGETAHLLQRLTIKVSRFYRNARTFDYIAQHVIPALTASRGGAPLRFWSAGCGCGEEAYTLAMLLEQAGVPGEVEATDIDPWALGMAQEARYSDEQIAELPAALREAYCDFTDGGYRVAAPVRARVRFGRHDLTADVPAAAYDLVCCRNVLIYLGQTAQRAAFARLHSALSPDGWLCIGEAEWPLPEYAQRLTVAAPGTYVFRRRA